MPKVFADFLGQLPAGGRMIFMLNIVLRALDWVFERIMGLDEFGEAGWISGVRIVGMVAQSKMTKYPFYRF